ncbi:MAG: RdgB/HAM1 family non-canonical purine NTP pyrophosphatase [Alphaproteobacteria bacterium]|nr:RdgB/HAM1 family non-canonical purine NTP pyrophosphatase [Alphaproteobacteria bacterium]
MPFITPYRKLIIASHNDGKVIEIAALLRDFNDDIISAKQLNIVEPEETATDFAGNARLKAEHCMQAGGFPALADDSGLSIDALDGAPGIYSARFAQQHGGFTDAFSHLAKILADKKNLNAHFTCALALAVPNMETKIFESHVHGSLCFPPRGIHGFGYDPIFIANGCKTTFGEMLPAQKHAISHRFNAFQKLQTFLHAKI